MRCRSPRTAIEAPNASTRSAAIKQRRADGEHAPAIHAIREPARGIRRQRVRDVHDDEHGRHVADAKPDVGDLQDQERFAEAREREQARRRARATRSARRARRRSARELGPRRAARASSRAPARARTARARRRTRRAGTTASQNTVRNASSVAAISAIASSGPAKAPTVSSVCRKPNAAPRTRRGVSSAISASRGAPRMPLPTRSMPRAANTQPAVGASANSGFVTRREPVAQDRQQLALAEPIADRAREHLRDRRDGLGRALEQADGRHARAEHADQEHGQQRVDHLRGDVHEQADEAERPHPARDRERAGRARGSMTSREGLHRCGRGR